MKKILLLVIILFLHISNANTNINENVLDYCIKNKYTYCLLINFSEPTSTKRMKLYDIKNNKIVYSCKCAHGNGKGNKIEANINSFSNKIGSNKSSLGKYRIGRKRILYNFKGIDISMFKIPCYELYGLDSSNNNAYKRGILLHADPLLSDLPFPISTIHSFGCFSISYSSFRKLSKYIDNNKVLIFAYYNKK